MFTIDPQHEAQTALVRLLPRLEPLFDDANEYQRFTSRLQGQFPRLFPLLLSLYGGRYDFFYHLEQILITTAQAFIARPASLRTLDQQRLDDPAWFQREDRVGLVLYVDRFAGTLAGLHDKIDYLTELGITYLHLMPLFKSPAENNDGGYAVSDYRQVDPTLGTIDELFTLAALLRARGISLVLDFVFNHTSDEHEWALRALNGEQAYQDYYYIFPDRILPDQLAPHLREIFPESAPGNFTYRGEIDSWVWTTFNNYQWDLNYRRPETFNAMLGEMLFLANQGVEVLRLDAVAFIWKEPGTPCENLPQVHQIIQAYNALAQVVAPAMLFKSEAIVHPDDVVRYVSWEEAPLSYNPTLMALLWESLATREVRLLRYSMTRRFHLPERTSWVNYVRVHDDIGWSFADEDAAALHINGFDHRQFLNAFYTGGFGGSFAQGLPFNFNPVTRDMRICGTTASLAGLEQAVRRGDLGRTEDALRRILLVYGIIMSIGGIPLIYSGDEIALFNDSHYRDDPARATDNRWAHRPAFDWTRAAQRDDPSSPVGRVFGALKRMIALRQALPALADNGHTTFFDTGCPHVLGYVRSAQVLVLANFSEDVQVLPREKLAIYWPPVPGPLHELLSDAPLPAGDALHLPGGGLYWLTAQGV